MVWETLPSRRTKLRAGIQYDVVEESLRHLAGTVLNDDLIIDFCWRMAGNLPRLSCNRPAPPWHFQKIREWVPMRITACRYEPRRTGLGVLFTMRIMAGTPCPRIIQKWVSLSVCKLLARATGFTLRRRRDVMPYPYSVPHQMVGFLIYGLAEPDESRSEPGVNLPVVTPDGFPEIAKEVFPSAALTYNRYMLDLTFRLTREHACPKGFTPARVQCHKCPFGFQTCPAGKHRLDWVRRSCAQCERDKVFFDPELSDDVCVSCFQKNAFKNAFKGRQ